ncbi:MAG TPA: hypothetical protein VE907_04690 [Gammaproteobacteria bacterium]|nr:hypothetical protein [Gammaproteobacteria bacterium]
MDSKRFLRLGTFLVALGLLSVARATLVGSPVGHVVSISSYAQYGGVPGVGTDVIFLMEGTTPGCDGFWLSPNDPGYKQTLAVLLMLKATGGQAIAGGYTEAPWPGSSTGNFCRVFGLTAQ